MRKKYKVGLGLIALLTIVFSVMLIIRRWPDPPVEELRSAGDAIREARKAEASKYAPRLFNLAVNSYDSALVRSKFENRRFFLNRDYGKVREFALQAAEQGLNAYEASITKAGTVRQTTGATLAELEKIIAGFNSHYTRLPLDKPVRQEFNRGVMLLSEAKLAREKTDFHIAEEKLAKAGEMIKRSDSKARKMLESYFSSFPAWNKQVLEAIALSARNRSTVVIVDKLAHRCQVYQSGTLKKEFPSEFGSNWLIQKYYKGDKATPEGTYRITHKKDKRKTIYYKALLLNYPNDEDRVRFRNNVASGKIAGSHEIGGLIEIHGHGGKGVDWTNGCIALSNNDMDIIFSMVSVNTPVVIVGSTIPIEKYLNHARP